MTDKFGGHSDLGPARQEPSPPRTIGVLAGMLPSLAVMLLHKRYERDFAGLGLAGDLPEENRLMRHKAL